MNFWATKQQITRKKAEKLNKTIINIISLYSVILLQHRAVYAH